MGKKLLGLLVLGGLAYGGFWVVEHSATRTTEIPEKTPGVEREQEILRAFFTEEVAQKKIGHLLLSDLEDFEAVVQPRPDLSSVIAQFGEPDSIVNRDVPAVGTPRKGRFHYYGRLGLGTRAGLEDQQIYWIHIRRR